MQKMKVVFMGTPDFSVPVLEGLIENYDVIGVVTQPDKEVGRHKEKMFSPIKKVAVEHGIKVLQPVKIRKEYEEILNLNPEMIVTCAYGQIIPKELLELPNYGCINVHASLLPKLRGGAPLHHAIIDGYKETGVTIMYMDEKMDSGDIITQKKIDITDDMNVGILHDKLSILGKELLLETIPKIIAKEINPQKQVLEEVTFASVITREDEKIDFRLTTREIFNKIRGMNPFPGAYAKLDNKIIKIYEARIGEEKQNKSVGQITKIYKDGIGIQTQDGEIIVTMIQIEGKKRMSVKDYLNGVEKETLMKMSFE